MKREGGFGEAVGRGDEVLVVAGGVNAVLDDHQFRALPRVVQHPRVAGERTEVESPVHDHAGDVLEHVPLAGQLVVGQPAAVAEVVRDQAVDELGVPGLHFHDLRHTGNTLAARGGGSLQDLMARMGHDNVRAAIAYQHASSEEDRTIADALSARVEAAWRSDDDDSEEYEEQDRGDDDGDGGAAGVPVPVS